MSSQNSKEVLLKDLTQTELNQESTSSLFTKMYKEGGSFENAIQIIQTQIVPELEQKISSLADQKEEALESTFFVCKTILQETQKWLEIAFSSYQQQKLPSDIFSTEQLYQNTLSLLAALNRKIDVYGPQLLCYRKTKLATDFTGQIHSLLQEMNAFLFNHFEIQKRIELLHFHISQKVFKKITDRLAEAKVFILKHRAAWEKEVIVSARNLYIHIPDEYPYPILYTREGCIYIIQEVVEHFVGAGSSKYVSRTFEMQYGHIRALIRPKKKLPDDLPDFDRNFFKAFYFSQSMREVKFLQALRGCEGIITQYEAVIFEQNGEKNLYQICELFDSQELYQILKKMDSSEAQLQVSNIELIDITRNMLNGLAAIHKANIIHHDLKINNILVRLATSKEPAQARIIDFNTSCYTKEDEKKCETALAFYSPPEFCKVLYEMQESNDPKFIPVTTFGMDIWAMGCILYQLFFEIKLPWLKENALNELQDEQSNLDHALEISLLMDNWIAKKFHSHPFYPLINSMLKVDPEERINVVQALDLFEQLAPTFLERL